MEEMERRLKEHLPWLLGLRNVIGAGIGYKERRGLRTDEPALVVLVSKKLPRAQLAAKDVVPETIDGMPTDVIEVGEVKILQRNKAQRPAHPGVSIGHYQVSAGTFGAVVYDRQRKIPLILSNNHILANLTNGSDGRGAIGDPVLQPGPYDGGTTKDAIGQLTRFVPVHYFSLLSGIVTRSSELKLPRPDFTPWTPQKNQPVNRIDAAVAEPYAPNLISPEILGLGWVKGITEPRLQMRVRKSGRTSGVTAGRVQIVNTTLRVEMAENVWAVFSDQIVSDMRTLPGDSGALVLDDANQAMGLLFAGSETISVINRIDYVCEDLGITLVKP